MFLRSAILATSLALSLLAADAGSQDKRHWPKVRVGGFTVNAGYTRFGRGYPLFFPGYYGYYPASWGYGSMWYNPFLFGSVHPGFYSGFGYGPSLGEVKLQGVKKAAWVYLDGALAGRADKLKSMWLEPGRYELEIREPSAAVRMQKIYVLSGKRMNVTPEMMEVR